MANQAEFRFYAELNDFLPKANRKRAFVYQFEGNPAVKDSIEAIGVPHVEVELIVVNGSSVSFSHQIKDNDRVAVYPVFESFDVSPVIKLREQLLRNTKFILDVHLGKLAKYLRMLGFDTLYQNDFDDPEIVDIAKRENRIILTRDIGILKIKSVTHGYWLRSQHPSKQLEEVVKRFHLSNSINLFERCMDCNGKIAEVDKDKILENLKPKTKKYYKQFYQCDNCGKIYWEGSHFVQMKKFAHRFLNENETKTC